MASPAPKQKSKQRKKSRRLGKGLIGLAVVTGLTGALPLSVIGSSHREAPLISGDPKADATDLYAFVSKDKPDSVNLIANYSPFQDPYGGPNFYQFDDNVQYDINIDNNGDAAADVTYQYKFKTVTQNPKTFLYNTGPVKTLDDPNLNVRQTYTLTRISGGQSTVIGENIPTPPSNVGEKSTPDYEQLQQQAVKTFGGTTTFAGQSDDPFFAELGGIFDLLSVKDPNSKEAGIDRLQNKTVQSLALQVPISDLTVNKAKPADATDPKGIVGVWTTASRPSTSVLNGNGTGTASGNQVQVSRLGNPLVNEVVAPRGAKDLFNSSKPSGDAQFANAVTNPELGTLLNKLYDVKVPPQGDFGTPEARDDLVAIFLTGVPELTAVPNAKASEQLRLNTGVPPTEEPNRLGVLAKDTQGFPNGRRLADDVVDISLQAVGGAAYPLFHKDFMVDPKVATLSDGVDKNDKEFRSSFPYLALPDSGTDSGATGSNVQTKGSSNDKSMGGMTAVIALIALALGAAGASLLRSGEKKA